MATPEEYQQWQDYEDWIEYQKSLAAPPPAESPSPNDSALGMIGGAAKGYLKGLPQIVTAPADLLVRGEEYLAQNLFGAAPIENLEQFLPSNLVSNAVDYWSGDVPANKTAEAVGEGVGIVAGGLAGPSLVRGVAKATGPEMTTLPAIVGPGAKYASQGMGVVPRTLAIGTAGAAEGALVNSALAAKDPNSNLADEAVTGAFIGGPVAAAGPILGEVASDIAPSLSRASDRLMESSIGARVKDFVASRKTSGVEMGPSGALETKLSNAIRETAQEGIFPALRNPAKTSIAISEARDTVGAQIGAVMGEIDNAGIRPRLTFENTIQAIDNAPFTLREDLTAQAKAFTDTLKNWNGTASELHKAKSSLGTIAYNGSAKGNAPATISKRIQRAIERDLRQALQGSLDDAIEAGAVPAERSAQFAEMNRRFGNFAKVEEIVEDTAIRAQHQQIGPMQRAMWTTTGFGVPMAGAYAVGGAPAALGVYGLGVASRTRAGQAVGSALAGGGAQALQLLDQIANNPYFINGLSLAAMPRDWSEVKSDPTARGMVAAKIGIDPVEFDSLPEPQQMALHAQAVLSDPIGSEPAPQNLNLVNGKFVDPMERDAVIREALDLPPAERARVIGAAFQNKYAPPPGAESPAPSLPQRPPIDIGAMTSSMESALTPQTGQEDYSYDGQASSMIDELERATSRHAASEFH